VDAVQRILAEGDPFTEVLNALWSLLEASVEFTTLVPPGNRIKFTGANTNPVPEEVSLSMVPEVRLICTSSEPHPYRTTNSHSSMQRFEVQVSSGDQRLDAMHNPLKWIVFKALKDVEKQLLAMVRWKGEAVLKLAKPVTISEGVSRQDLNRGIIGWSSVWGVECELWFQIER
jgi:hypothetical protein